MNWLEGLRHEAEVLREQLLQGVAHRRGRFSEGSSADEIVLGPDESEKQKDRDIELRCANALPNHTLCPRCFYETGVISAMKAVRPIADPNSNSFSCETCGRLARYYGSRDPRNQDTRKPPVMVGPVMNALQ